MSSFLESLLPTVIGGATAVFAPEALPYVIGGIGLANYAKTGSVTKGVLAGLGAYGGSGLATSAAALGTQAAGSELAVNGMDLASDQVTKSAAPSVLAGAGQNASNFASGLSTAVSDPSSLVTQAGGYGALAKTAGMAAAPAILGAMGQGASLSSQPNTANITPYTYARNPVDPSKLNQIGANYVPGQNPDTSERVYFHPQYTALPPYTYTAAGGGTVPPPTSFNNMNAPMSHNANADYANYSQMPMPQNPMSSGATLMADGGSAMDPVSRLAVDSYVPSVDPKTGRLYDANFGSGNGFLNGLTGGLSEIGQGIGNGISSIGRSLGFADRGFVDMKSNDMPDRSEFGNLANARDQLPPIPIGNGLAVMPNTNMSFDQFKQNPSGTVAYNTSLSPTLHAGVSASGDFDQGTKGVHNVVANLSKQLGQDSSLSGFVSKAPGSYSPNAFGINYRHNFADGGQSGGNGHLGDYSDGGRLLKGPGDGVSDSIPATIAGKQPARLADGEFVVPARIVSELGNGSTDAGARKLYDMLDRIQRARGESVGKGKVAKNTKADRYLPA